MKKTLLHVFSFKALFVLYIPIYVMFYYKLSWFDIGINTAVLFALFWEIKNIIGVRFVNDFHECGFEIITEDDKD